MTDQAQYERDEQRAIHEIWIRDTTAACPRCAVAMTSRPIGGGSFGLGYARNRTWLICPSCRRSIIFDVRRGTRT